ncbi:MAG: transcription termination/antitermination protein NusG [Planctomycetota bacterium]
MSSTDPSDEALTESATISGVDGETGTAGVDGEENVAAEASDEGVSDSPAPPPPAPAPPPAKVEAEGAAESDEPKNTVRPINLDGSPDTGDAPTMDWYILKVAFNREDSVADALRTNVKREGMDEYFGEIFVPTEDVATFTRDGKRRITKRKLLPGYIMVKMIINDDSWFLVRETGGISDFTGAAGKPMPMEPEDIERFINAPQVEDEDEEPQIKIGIPFKVGDRVRVKEGNFENQEGDVDGVDQANGRVTVIINIFGRSVPMELDHWQVEPL